jgi:hypothetical protein
MQSDLQSSVLWEDLSEIETRIEKTLATLQSLQRAIEEGRVGQPTRQDSKRLNRLMVLADQMPPLRPVGMDKCHPSRRYRDISYSLKLWKMPGRRDRVFFLARPRVELQAPPNHRMPDFWLHLEDSRHKLDSKMITSRRDS